MATVTQPRQRRKPVRTARLVPIDADLPFDLWSLLLTVDGKATEYDLERVGSDEGDEYKLTKRVGDPGDECPTYRVVLADDGCRCNCPGFRQHRHCKHVESLCALRAAGRV